MLEQLCGRLCQQRLELEGRLHEIENEIECSVMLRPRQRVLERLYDLEGEKVKTTVQREQDQKDFRQELTHCGRAIVVAS